MIGDNRHVRRIMRQFFETLTSWKVSGEARDGAEAIQKAREFKPDLVLLDFSMPKINGIETASILKKMWPDVYVVLFTVFDDAVSSRLSSAVGVDLVITKADGLSGLEKALQHLMANAKMVGGTDAVDNNLSAL